MTPGEWFALAVLLGLIGFRVWVARGAPRTGGDVAPEEDRDAD